MVVIILPVVYHPHNIGALHIQCNLQCLLIYISLFAIANTSHYIAFNCCGMWCLSWLRQNVSFCICAHPRVEGTAHTMKYNVHVYYPWLMVRGMVNTIAQC